MDLREKICYNKNAMKTDANKLIKCSFIGHRTVEDSRQVASILKKSIITLIEKKGVNTFLFGSRSEFNDICHQVVTELRVQYPVLTRIAYTCRSEWACMESEREENERGFSKIMNKEISLKGYEGEVEFDKKYEAGRASYIERNQAMINDSDVCIFYYNDTYKPKGSGKSGTKIAYEYALRKAQKKKGEFEIINIYRK